jgi:hypothetical protein
MRASAQPCRLASLARRRESPRVAQPCDLGATRARGDVTTQAPRVHAVLGDVLSLCHGPAFLFDLEDRDGGVGLAAYPLPAGDGVGGLTVVVAGSAADLVDRARSARTPLPQLWAR